MMNSFPVFYLLSLLLLFVYCLNFVCVFHSFMHNIGCAFLENILYH